jgi:anti-sigma regulatory factor (Ser/Thr protein kinase)
VHDVLLRREVAHGVEVIVVDGPIVDGDAGVLGRAIADASRLAPRGVLVDLSGATDISRRALKVLCDARGAAPGWPRPALVVCSTDQRLTAALGGTLPVHACREEGYAHVDDRSTAPRRRMDLDGSMHSPAAARAMAADVVADQQLDTVADDLALVVSELVTNAIRYAQPPVEIEIETTDSAVTVAVADGSPGRPQPRDADDDAEGGRGLTLIDLVATETGVRPKPPGKTVWAALQRP